MKIGVYYHAYLDDNFLWSQILLEQFRAMEESGLDKRIEKFRITATTQDDKRTELFYKFCCLYNMPIQIQFIKNEYPNDVEMMSDLSNIFANISRNVDERYTLSKMHDDAKNEDMLILYLHSKGVTSIINNLIPGLVSKYRNRFYWRNFMNYTITDWERAILALDAYDTAGVDYQFDPAAHYRGNFFWTKSSHVKTLSSPSTIEWWYDLKIRVDNDWLNKVNDRFASEMWICSRHDTKSFNLRSNNGDYIASDI